jgi:hypothetical protein
VRDAEVVVEAGTLDDGPSVVEELDTLEITEELDEEDDP